MVATNASVALAALKSSSTPAFLRVKEQGSENLAQVVVPNVKRWKQKLASILDSLPWDWMEPLDKAGNLIGIRVDNPEAGGAGELEDFEDLEPVGNVANGLAGLQGMTALILKAQDVALTRQRQAYSDVLDNNQKLLSVISDRLGKMEMNAQQQFEVITALHNRLNMEVLNGVEEGESADDMVAKVLGNVLTAKIQSTGGGTPSGTEGGAS